MNGIPVDPAAAIEQTDGVSYTDQLPAGTLTFLLTDVEGSTRLWETRPDEMAAAIARHYDLLDAAIMAGGGHRPEEQGEGDSVVAVFTHAPDALRAAVEAQRLLATELPWLPVRMALHTGTAILRDPRNYVGPAIIRCARLRACAHGGQIVVSDAMASLVVDELATGVSLLGVGQVTVRGMQRPEQVWQVIHPNLRAGFPPLHDVAGTPTNVPAAFTSLIGRERDAEQVIALVRSGRLVMLSGAGGSGKTRLAMNVAGSLLDDFPGGVWWVDLAPVGTDSAVFEQFAGAVHASLGPGDEARERIAARLRSSGDVLLCIDNAEHVVDIVADLTATLLASCPSLSVLVTSREPLGVPGETVFRVPALRVPRPDETTAAVLRDYESVRLFAERAANARPNFVLDDRNAPHVAAICARLDGLPLAIELAAARVRAMPVERVAAGLDHAFRVLGGAGRTTVARQRTMAASIAWSVDRLDEAERIVLVRLAVFQASFVLDAAESVAADERIDTAEVFDLIERLVDKSLVQFDGSADRYRLLEPIRQYCLDTLADPVDVEGARTRHARWVADWAGEVRAGVHGIAFPVGHPFTADIAAAFDHSCDTEPSTAYRLVGGLAVIQVDLGQLALLQREYDWVTTRNGDDDPVGWARAVAGLAYQAPSMQWFDIAGHVERAASILDGHDVEALRLLEIPAAAFDSVMLLDTVSTTDLLDRAVADEDVWVMEQMTAAKMLADNSLGRFDTSDQDFDRWRTVVERRGCGVDTFGCGPSLPLYVSSLTERGRLLEALTLATRPSEIVGSPMVAAVCYSRLAEATGDDELHRGVSRYVEESAVFAIGSSSRLAVQSYLKMRAGNTSAAATMLEQALDHYELAPLTASNFYRWMVPLALAAGRRAIVDDYIGRYADAAAPFPDAPLPVALIGHMRALVARHDGRQEALAGELHSALPVALQGDLVLAVIDLLELIAESSARAGDDVGAARLFAAAAVERRRIGYVGVVAPDPQTLRDLGRRLRTEQSAAWTEGEGLTVSEAVELAQRTRGSRRRPSFGWDSLTPTERRVVELVANGLPNDDVARRLIMSVATVKTHLTHAFTKTGTANRTELTTRWHQHHSGPLE